MRRSAAPTDRKVVIAVIAAFIISCRNAPPSLARVVSRPWAVKKKPLTHPPVDDPKMARMVDAAIYTNDFPIEVSERVKEKPYVRGKFVILSNDDNNVSMQYSWLNARLPPELRARTLEEAGTIVVAQRNSQIVYTVIAPPAGQHFAERSDFFDVYTVTLIDRQRKVSLAERTFDSKASRYSPPRADDIVNAMTSWIEGLPRRPYAPQPDTKIPQTDTSAARSK
jgi:hypothetical protein